MQKNKTVILFFLWKMKLHDQSMIFEIKWSQKKLVFLILALCLAVLKPVFTSVVMFENKDLIMSEFVPSTSVTQWF